MKIKCDVCDHLEAAFFCVADEAALCEGCDHRVHHANKLASKHQRFSLLRSSPKETPVCDTCQERKAFLFCQQDRAVLCRDCDVSIHTVSEHVKKHDRFLLTGVKLSPTSSVYCTQHLIMESGQTNPHPPSVPEALGDKIPNNGGFDDLLTSNVSEYLMEMLPGWRCEDLPGNPCSVLPFGFSKCYDGNTSLPNGEDVRNHESSGFWVPQAPNALYTAHFQASSRVGLADQNKKSVTNKRWTDDGFTVPQLSPQSTWNKRCRRPFI